MRWDPVSYLGLMASEVWVHSCLILLFGPVVAQYHVERAHSRNEFFTSWYMKSQESRMKKWYFKYPHLQTAPSAISILSRCSSLKGSAPSNKHHVLMTKSYTFICQTITEKRCLFGLWSTRLSAVILIVLIVSIPGMSELNFSRDFLALDVTLSFISHIFSIFLVVSQTGPG